MEPDIDTYLRLVWLFAVSVTILFFFLFYLYVFMQKAKKSESQTLALSHLIIEGMETERRRISRELHDNILPQVRGLEVSDQIRGICMELTPPDFTRLSLKESLANICEKFHKKTGIECICSIDKDLKFTGINAENQLHIFRIAQEAFTNIEKHAQAKKVSFIVRHDIDKILICVSDDGVGISKNEGLGMKSMRQRAAIAGAQLDFINESGNGVMVRLKI